MADSLDIQETLKDTSRDELEARKAEIADNGFDEMEEWMAIKDELALRDRKESGREPQDETSMPDSYI